MSQHPTRDLVSGEEHARVKAQLARVEAVLADLLNERSGSTTPPALQREMMSWLEHAPALHDFLNVDPFQYRDADGELTCRFCDHVEGGHYFQTSTECDLLKLWRVLGDERYQKTIDAMFERWCAEEERREINAHNRVTTIADPNVPPGMAYLLSEEQWGPGLAGRLMATQAMIFAATPRIVGIDFGAQSDKSAVVVAHEEDGKLVVDDTFTTK